MGRPKPGHAEYNDMFSTAKPFESIKFAHPAVTSFAAQLVEEHLVKNATLLASLEGGLHTWNPDTGREIKTETFGAETLQAATVATPKHRDRLSRAKNASLDQRAAARNHCPPEIVAAHAISSLIFSRNRNANLLPTDKGMLLFSCDANRYLFAHESRIGASVSYHAVLDALDHFAQADGESVLAMAWDEDGSGIVRFDNLQKQVHARYERVGWEARMMIGCAGTFCKAEGFKKEAVSLQKKREWLAKNLRATLTFNQLWDLIDHDYLSNVLPLLWLQILIDILSTVIPEASRTYHSELHELFLEFGIKRNASPRKTCIFPLKSNAYNETITSDLLKALKDFLAQLGQTTESYSPWLILAGGDGLSYERMIQLKNYLQFGTNEFDRLEIIEPFLEIWHTLWTNLSRIYEAHWVGLTSADPSTLGFGANSLKRRAPGNVSKVDYYPYIDLLDSQVDARVLDIWSNEFRTKDLVADFELWSKTDKLPTMVDLHQRAIKLHQKFGTHKAFFRLMENGTGYKSGTEWVAGKKDPSSANLGLGAKRGKTAEEKEKSVFEGDESLARSTRLICDGLLSRLASDSCRSGDIGCVWECMKMMTFTFAGSSHTKYTNYLLEMISNFELEASPELREFFLENWLISSNGRTFEPGDLFQEQLQEELYAQINHDQGFDDPHTRERLAPNVYRFRQTKKAHHASLGLTARSGNHIAPSRIADIRKLMSMYQREELHLFRKGRQYEEADSLRVDDHGQGVLSLMEGRLEKWARETRRARNLHDGGERYYRSDAFDTPVDGITQNEVLRTDGFAFDPDSGPVDAVTADRQEVEILDEEFDVDKERDDTLKE
ncbi:hypothetical protein F5050DRAFT_1559760 [Lentinula boryana]|uniref:DUF6589 domain-containing protein n=1 Tax=Lentinula boryana TaxID=40481 RepID=A0ABQ8QU33_9AGAR|nr:hypothetical protein F5050DRAFT_1559760 [Lentinula boryana]